MSLFFVPDKVVSEEDYFRVIQALGDQLFKLKQVIFSKSKISSKELTKVSGIYKRTYNEQRKIVRECCEKYNLFYPGLYGIEGKNKKYLDWYFEQREKYLNI